MKKQFQIIVTNKRMPALAAMAAAGIVAATALASSLQYSLILKVILSSLHLHSPYRPL